MSQVLEDRDILLDIWTKQILSTPPPDSERITDIFDDKETDQDAQNGHLTKPFYQAHAHPPEDDTDEKSGDITVPYCCPRTFKTETKRIFHIFTLSKVVFDTLK